MMTKRAKRQYQTEFVNLEEMIPQDHFLRVIEKYFDWNFIYEEVEKQYFKDFQTNEEYVKSKRLTNF